MEVQVADVESEKLTARRGQRAKWWPWAVCGFLFFATLISYLDRQSFSVMAPVIQQDFALSNERLGLLLSAFYLSYGIMHLFVGYFLDNYNIRKVYALFVFLWSIPQLLTGLTRSYNTLYASRFALGIFESAGQTGAARIISRIVGVRDRTLANGIMMSGGSIGAAIAPALMIWINDQWGWRPGFVILGVVGMIWAVAFYLWFRPAPEVLLGEPRSHQHNPEDEWRHILRDRRFWVCACGAFFTIPLIHVIGAWLPTYFVQTWNVGMKTDLAVYLVAIYIAFDISLLASGGAVSIMTRRGVPPGKAKKIVLAVAAACMASVVAIRFAGDVKTAVMLILLLNVGRAAFGSLFLTFNQEISPRRVGMIAGIMGAIGAFSGSLLVYLFGFISETSGFLLPFTMVGIFALLGCLPILFTTWDIRTKKTGL